MSRRYEEVDVFGRRPFLGNPLAVVLDAEGLSTELMQRIARWTNFSETAFLLPPGKRRPSVSQPCERRRWRQEERSLSA